MLRYLKELGFAVAFLVVVLLVVSSVLSLVDNHGFSRAFGHHHWLPHAALFFTVALAVLFICIYLIRFFWRR